ncbi:MAG: DUF1501 domain-containing protein [Pirellulales bacterium]
MHILSRRQLLQQTGCGFGMLAMAGLAAQSAAAGADNPLAARPTHHLPRAKRMIFLFMQGGVSHVDSYDYKPRLEIDDGKQMPFEDARAIANSGTRQDSQQRVMKPLWKYSQWGESGRWASDLFPHMNRHVDKMCFVHSMKTEGIAHGPATLFLHCGSANFIRPSLGSWLLYGLGSESENLPGFVSIAPSVGNGGPRNYGNAFLPAIYQGTALGRAGSAAKDATIRNLSNGGASPDQQLAQFELLRRINADQLAQHPADAEFEAVASSYELAWRMQQHAPETLDLSQETAETQQLYGIGEAATDNFGRQCLLARRMCESGVRYIQVTYGDNSANPAWDQHSDLPKHGVHAQAVDKPIAGLLADLARRGLLEDTLVWWGGEFGRTPYAEKNGTGRDHNVGGFTVWLAGGGVKAGLAHGQTDDFGHKAVANAVHMHDLHATLLHLLGLDHQRLTYRYLGRDFRLTDVAGNVVHELMA